MQTLDVAVEECDDEADAESEALPCCEVCGSEYGTFGRHADYNMCPDCYDEIEDERDAEIAAQRGRRPEPPTPWD